MDQGDNKALIDGLTKAIQAERDGHGFYRMAAASSADTKAKEVFSQLAEEELAHMNFLMEQHDAIIKTGKPSESVQLPKPLDLSGISPIFSENIKTRIQDAHLEMSALSIGIQLEKDAIAFYKSEAEASYNPAVTAFYESLAAWEGEHYHALLRQRDELAEDYNNANRFARF